MEDMQFISCVRFSLQLMIAEAFFILGWNRKHHFILRLLISFAVYFLSVSLLFHLFVSIPGSNPVIYTLYYISMFFFDFGRDEMLFSGKGEGNSICRRLCLCHPAYRFCVFYDFSGDNRNCAESGT